MPECVVDYLFLLRLVQRLLVVETGRRASGPPTLVAGACTENEISGKSRAFTWCCSLAVRMGMASTTRGKSSSDTE